MKTQILDKVISWLDHDIMLSQRAIYEDGNQPVATDGSDDFFKGNLYTSQSLLDQIKQWQQEESK